MESEKEKLRKQKLEESLKEYKQWTDVSWAAKNWRAWGSWFSWGSPVGLGLFLVLVAIAFAVVKFAIGL